MLPASFSDIAIVSCGTLTLELNHLKETGFLDARQILYTTPGLHERPKELERQLVKRVEKAKEEASKVGDKMIEEARLSIESEKHTAIKEIKNQVAELSLQITERLLKKNLSKEKEQKELINEYIKDLKLN